MCGLAGQFCFGDARTAPGVLRHMLAAQEIRGKDSAGVAYLRNNEIMVAKKAVAPKDFIEHTLSSKTWTEIAASPVVLLHARHATQGIAAHNENNHPVLAADWVVTHNGHVTNDYDLIQYYGMTKERPAAVDTVAINLALAQGETIEESLSHVSLIDGKATFLAWHVHRPKEILLARINGPALYLHRSKDKILYWSSDTDGLQKTAKPELGNVEFINVATLPQNTAFLLTPTGVRQYDLAVRPFRLPKPLPKPVTYKNKKETTEPSGPLVTNFKPGLVVLPDSGSQKTTTALSIVGVSEPGRLPIASKAQDLTKVMDRWLNHNKGFTTTTTESGTDINYNFTILTKQESIKCHEDYKALAKPAPQFEAGMLGIVGFPPLTAATFKTPYGTWLVTPNNRWFRGAKRVKSFWLEQITLPTGYDVVLPAYPALREKLHDSKKLEIIRLYSKDDEGQLCLMCPWCGIISKIMTWKDWGYTCTWCWVKSKVKE